MRRFVLVLALVLGFALPVYAQQAGDEQPRSYESLSKREREREMQAQQWKGPSGMWTSPHAAKGGAYRYRMMGIGAVLLLGMGLLTYRLIKRANAQRIAR
jgi:hypothetical protein